MTKNTKVAIAVLVVLAVLTGVYFISKNNSGSIGEISDIENQNTEENGIVSETASTDIAPVTTKTDTKITTNNKATSPIAPDTQSLITYKSEFFPFEFSYPANFRLAKNLQPSTKERESKSYNFNRIAYDGGIAGYMSFYVSMDNDSKYKDLVKSYPSEYSIVEINGMKFYKRVEKDKSSNNGYNVEYITYKGGIEYRFSLVVVNGDKKALDIKAYQPELDMMEGIAKSLKIR